MEYLVNSTIPWAIIEIENYSKVMRSIQSMFSHHMKLS